MALLYIDPGWTHIMHEEVAIARTRRLLKQYSPFVIGIEDIEDEKLLRLFINVTDAKQGGDKLEGIGYMKQGFTCLYEKGIENE